MDDLKRVGLVWKDDGSVDFVKSLKLVNATLKENYENFKLTQEQWDKSTTVTQKLKDTLVYLNEAYDIQKDKVTTLKIQLEELENAEDKDEVAIQKKKAALTQAETSLQKYKNKIEETTSKLNSGSEAIKAYGEKVTEEGEKIEKAGNKISAFSVATLTALTASAKGAIDFQSAFTGVEKTVDATDEQLDEISSQIRQMAKEIPSTTTEISAVAEAAGQLGIKTEDIMSFTRVMIDLGNSTNLSAEEAASSLAKFANVTNMSADNYSNLGSVVVALGNNFATTEADIVSMATRLAGAGTQIGLSQDEIMAFSTALSSVGIEAEMGGSAFSKAMIKMQVACEGGTKSVEEIEKKTGRTLRDLELMSENCSKDFGELANSIGMTKSEIKAIISSGNELENFAEIAGMTAKEFENAYKKDASEALRLFISGLGNTEKAGESTIKMLQDMGFTEVRLRDSLTRLANNSTNVAEAIKLADESWKENNALTNEANKRYETLKSKMIVALNKIQDIGITLGNKLMPSIEKILKKVDDWSDKFNELNDDQVELIVNLGLLITALSPVISTIGKMTTGIGQLITSYGKFREGLGLLITKSAESGSAMTGLLSVIQGMTSPVGIACLAIGAAITGITIASHKANEDVKKDFSTIGNSATEFVNGIDTAKSHLSSFNSTLFASAEEQQKLQQNMDEIQAGITTICKTASDERRNYTQEEIIQLDEYFTKLRELKDREIQIQSEMATAITQQSTSNAESFQGSLEEYKIQSQEWIKTAIEQKDATIKLIEEGTIEEVALLNQRYATEEQRQSEAYQTEYNKIMEQKQAKIDSANDEVMKVNEAYANGYLKRVEQDNGFYAVVQEYNDKVEQEKNRHSSALTSIEDSMFLTEANKFNARVAENERHENELNSIWKKMYKNMDESQAEQLGVWLGLVSQTELYGGQIDQKSKNIVDSVISSYDRMPGKTREAMKNAMTPMLEEMQNSEPSLFAKATGIAEGILSRLRKAFDIHSPSKKTRAIFKNVMKGSELGIEDEEKNLLAQVDNLANKVNGSFSNVSPGDNIRNKEIINTVRHENFDYDKFAAVFVNAFITAMKYCKISMDEDGFAKFVDNRLMEVM